MSLAVDNIDVLRHGWEDAISTVTPDLGGVRAAMEDEFARAVADNRLDEQSLLAAVRDIVTVAAKSGGADSARLLSKALHRSVYEYLLSLDAMTPEETDVIDRPLGGGADPSLLIGFEEVAELEQRQSALMAAAAEVEDAAWVDGEAEVDVAAEVALEGPDDDTSEPAEAPAEPEEQAAPHDRAHYRPRLRLFRRGDHHDPDPGIEAAGEHAEDGASAPDAEPATADPAPPPPAAAAASPAPPAAPEWWRGPTALPAPEPPEPEATVVPLAEAIAEIAGEDDYFAEFEEPAAPVSWEPPQAEAPAAEPAPEPEAPAAAAPPAPEPDLSAASEPPEHTPPAASPDEGAPATWAVREPRPPGTDGGLGALEAWATGAHPVDATESFVPAFVVEPLGRSGPSHDDSGFTVAPREGFHLTEDNEFFTEVAEDGAAPEARGPHPAPASTPVEDALPGDQRPPAAGAAADADEEHPSWRVRRSPLHSPDVPPEMSADALADMLDAENGDGGGFADRDPRIADARNEINDRLRRRRCDEAASLLQRLATEVGGRSVAELALDAGDRCRALGKANAALSCYIAASRADPVFEVPLLRLADICLDDRDVDLAVSYLDRVARLHRMRGDTRGALRIYRKIATIAPYRDDILATLMRANSTGQFED